MISQSDVRSHAVLHYLCVCELPVLAIQMPHKQQTSETLCCCLRLEVFFFFPHQECVATSTVMCVTAVSYKDTQC